MDWNQSITVPHGFSEAEFSKPDTFLGPVYSWVWNAPTDEKSIIRQIDEMELAGIQVFYIIPEPPEFRPQTMITHMTPEYLSPEFFRLIRLAVEYARQKGMLVWIYDEGGWPSGNACGQLVRKRPDLAGKKVAVRDVKLAAGEGYVPGGQAVAAFKDHKRVSSGAKFPEETYLQEYYRQILEQKDSPVQPDLLEPETIPLFIELTHERYAAALGDLAESVVPCVFIDEPQTPMPALPWDFMDRFREEYGYDIGDWIYVLLEEDNLSQEASQARQDYADLITKLHVERFMTPIQAWCRAHHMLFTGHLDKDHAMEQFRSLYGNPLPLLRKLDMPGIDVIWRQIWPNEQPVEEGESFFPRISASIASQSGHLYSLSESFAVYGENLTPEDMRWIANYQFVRGIQILNPMVIPYGRKGALAYGERPFFCRDMPGYTHLTQWNLHMSRISYFVSCGLPVTDAALYLPAERLWRDRAEADSALKAYHDLGESLEAQGISFDVIDRAGILEGTVQEGRLCVGLAEYVKIYVPEGIDLPEDAAAVVRQLAGETKAWAWSDDPRLKLRTRRDEAGNLYIMVFCQSTEAVTGRIFVDTDRPLYQADAADGRVKPLTEASAGRQGLCVTLEPGQELLILTGAEEMKVQTPCDVICVREAELVTCRRTMKLELTKEGCIRNETVCEVETARDFAAMEGKDFSGEITYTFALMLTEEDCMGLAVLTLEKLEHSACVRVNGQHAGYLCLKPLRLSIPEGLLKAGENCLEIEVANTASNAYAHVDPLAWFDEGHVGPYNEREQVMERERDDGGLFGPVRVEIKKTEA